MDKIGKYEILEKIGTGGFGVVFKGRDPFIKRLVAIKTCASEDEDMRRRFFREAEIAGNLQHRNVTTVYDFGFQGEVPYLVQEYLPGEDLDRVIARGSLSDAQKLDCLIQVATGLAYAHAQGVIHRDIKPGNVRMVDGGRVKIMDFGIAKLAHLESQLTKTGMTLGTASYLAPEQIRGEEITQAADIFSFGVVAYELWASRRPFDAQSLSNLFFQVLSATPPPLLTMAPSCPPALAEIVDRCLGKEPEERWASAKDLLSALEAVRATMPETFERVPGADATRTLLVADYGDPEATTELSTATARGELAKVQQRVDELLAAGNATAAEIEVTLAQKRFANTPGAVGTLAPLLARVTEARSRKESERRRADKIEGLLERARALGHEGAYDEATLVLHAALEIAPEHDEAQQLLRAAEEAAAKETRRRALVSGVAAVGAKLERGELAAAEQDLLALEAEHGAAAELLPPREELLRRQRGARVAGLREEAERRLAKHDLTGALAVLGEGLRLAPGEPTLERRIAEVERLVAAERAAAARADAIDDTVILVQSDLTQGRWDDAAAHLDRAAAELGPAPEWDRLRQRLVAEREAARLAEAEERLAAEVADVEELLAAGKAKAARKALRKAEAAFGAEPALTTLAERVEAALRPAPAAPPPVAEPPPLPPTAPPSPSAAVSSTLAPPGSSAAMPLTPSTASAGAAARPASREATQPGVAPAASVQTQPLTSPWPARRRKARWIAAAAIVLPLLVALAFFWPGGEDSEKRDETSVSRGGIGAGSTSGPAATVAGEPQEATAPSTEPAAVQPIAPPAAPPAAAPLPSAAPSAPPSAEAAGAVRAVEAARRTRSALARNDRNAALREAAVAVEAAPGDPVVMALLGDVLRTARRAADDAAKRATAAAAAELAPRELAAAVARRRSGDGAAAIHPLDGARELWRSASLYDAATAAATAEGRRRQLLAQAAASAPAAAPTSAAAAPAPASVAPAPAAPPAQEPARPPEPRPSERPAAPPVDETAAVRSTINRYVRAYESLDAAAVQSVWPKVDAAALRRAFGSYRTLEMSVSDCNVQVQGDGATAVCQRSQQIQPTAGRQLSDNRKVRFRFHRAGGGWVIDGVDAL